MGGHLPSYCIPSGPAAFLGLQDLQSEWKHSGGAEVRVEKMLRCSSARAASGSLEWSSSPTSDLLCQFCDGEDGTKVFLPSARVSVRMDPTSRCLGAVLEIDSIWYLMCTMLALPPGLGGVQRGFTTGYLGLLPESDRWD